MTDQVVASTLENVELNDEGYLVDPQAWTPEIAQILALENSLMLYTHTFLIMGYPWQKDKQFLPELYLVKLDGMNPEVLQCLVLAI